jgi:hypothetical protein
MYNITVRCAHIVTYRRPEYTLLPNTTHSPQPLFRNQPRNSICYRSCLHAVLHEIIYDSMDQSWYPCQNGTTGAIYEAQIKTEYQIQGLVKMQSMLVDRLYLMYN